MSEQCCHERIQKARRRPGVDPRVVKDLAEAWRAVSLMYVDDDVLLKISAALQRKDVNEAMRALPNLTESLDKARQLVTFISNKMAKVYQDTANHEYKRVGSLMRVVVKTAGNKRYATFPVAAAAYGRHMQLHRNSSLTHVLDTETKRVLCNKVKADNLLDDWTYDTEAMPTCEVCAAKIAKINAREEQKKPKDEPKKEPKDKAPKVPTVDNRFAQVPHSKQWILEESSRLVVDISDEQRENLREVLVRRYDPTKRPEVIVRQIKAVIGLTNREASSVLNREDDMREEGVMSEQEIQRATQNYSEDLHQARGERIARTEAVFIETQAKDEAWLVARDDGLLPDEAGKEWITNQDACDQCDSMDGTVVGLDEHFITQKRGAIRGPPLHPQCVCSTELTLKRSKK